MMGNKRTGISIHELICNLPVLLQGFHIPLRSQRITAALFRSAESSRQATEHALLASQDALVISLEQDAHTVNHSVRVVEQMRVFGRVQDIRRVPRDVFGPCGLRRR